MSDMPEQVDAWEDSEGCTVELIHQPCACHGGWYDVPQHSVSHPDDIAAMRRMLDQIENFVVRLDRR